MSNVLMASERLVTEICYACGITFAMPEDYRNRALNDHSRSFYCPAGHQQHYVGKTEAEKLRDQLAEKERLLTVKQNQLADAYRQRDNISRENETLIRSRRSIQAHVKKIKTRASAGVCPAGCHRHFTNLQRHIATKHPTWKHEEEK